MAIAGTYSRNSIADEQKQNLPLGELSDSASSPVATEEGPKLPTYVAPETKLYQDLLGKESRGSCATQPVKLANKH